MRKRSGAVKYLVAAAVIFPISKGFEAVGDAAPLTSGGVSGDRLFFHSLALLVFLDVVGCLFRAGQLSFRFFRGGSISQPQALANVFDDPADAPGANDSSFDPDAALNRYMSRKNSAQASPTVAPSSGFGRRVV